MATEKSKFDRFAALTMANPSESRLTLARNVAFGSAAACLVVLTAIIQVGASNLALRIAVMGAAVGMPIWVALGFIYELYISLGKRSYPHIRREGVKQFLGFLQFAGGIALVSVIGAVLWHLAEDAAYVFAAVAVVILVLFYGFAGFMAYWWYGGSGPGKSEGPEK